MGLPILLIGILLCICGSAFFSASEMSFSSANKLRLENSAEEGDEGAKKAFWITEHFDDALSTILVGNNLVNIAASSMGSIVILLTLGEKYAWVSTLVITILVIIFGETIPKITAKRNATNMAIAFAPLTRFLMFILRPVTLLVVTLVNLITHFLKGEAEDEDAKVDELHSIIDTAEDENVLDEDESELINAAIDFADISVSEVMTARVDLVAIDIDDDREEILETIQNSSFSRIPVYEDSIDNVIGVLSVNHFLKASIDDPNVDIRTLMMKPIFIYKTIKLPDALSSFRSKQQHLAIVTDEYGGTMGVVSLEDIMEEIVGDIWDETDVIEEEIVAKNDDEFEIDGDMALDEFWETLSLDRNKFEEYESETVGGWCIEMMDRFPDVGQSFTYENYTIIIQDADDRRVKKVLIKKIKTPEEEKH
ncbi:MAG: HlyC/CorC family transporter [Erysipelotrichaceae bacterium]|nr:HlyC/CorC family transporter [Erysipelotrichaceae bacterium]